MRHKEALRAAEALIRAGRDLVGIIDALRSVGAKLRQEWILMAWTILLRAGRVLPRTHELSVVTVSGRGGNMFGTEKGPRRAAWVGGNKDQPGRSSSS